jgi:serine phosphatase RsbU (regulator of sigma subunit)/anti-sigma regulatory factor (Ser/Thr protein kinase)
MREAEVVTSCADLVRDCDWSDTGLGRRSSWPRAVEHAVRVLLESPVAMAYCHGPRFVMVYNDRMARVMGDKHPKSWAQPMAEVFPEVWDLPQVGVAFEQVLATGEPFYEEGTALALDRVGGAHLPEDAYFVRGISAVRDDTGAVLGLLVVAVETTEGFTRLRTVGDLATALATAASADDVVKAALRHGLQELGVQKVTVCLPERRAGGWRTTSRRRTDVVSRDEERLPLIWSPAEPETADTVVSVAASNTPVVTEDDGGSVVLPLRASGVTGAIEFEMADFQRAAFHRAVLTTCTQLVAEALARARLYDAERGTADLLQRTMLPQLLPHQPGVSLAVRYQPVTTGTAAGGDFYDAFEVSGGRMAVVIGDVVGRGVAAATVMGQVRAAVRGAALAVPDHDAVFRSLDQLVTNLDEVSSLRVGWYRHRSDDPLSLGVEGELFVTMLYCLLDPRTGEVTMASAGHFPPVLMRAHSPAGGSAQEARPLREVAFADLVPGPPLGVPGERAVATARLGEDDALLAFTDGLLERRDRNLVEGEAALLQVLAEVESYEPRSICQHTIEEMLSDGALEDDCAMLALVRTNAVHHTASVVVPPLASVVGRTRMWVERQLGEWDVDADVVWVAVMGVSELVTNVLLHAATDARVTLDLSPARLLVTVADTGTRGTPVRMAGDPTATRGRGLGLLSDLAHSCGVERNVSGSTVWFEVRLT